MTSVGEDTIETAALGRPFQLGMLYDCRKDTLIPGITLWNREQLQQNKDISSQVNTEFSVTTSDTIEEKSKHMKVDGELTLSLLGGNVQLSGAARYFNDTKKSFTQERLTLHYRTTCRFEQLTMNHLAQGKMDHHEVFDHDVATHVVTAVLYGADAYFVFDKMGNLSEDGCSAEGEGKINLAILKKVFSVGDAHLTLNMNEKEKCKLKNLSCTFYGDFQLRSNPSTFEDAVKVYTDLPKLIGENGKNAVPVKVWLFPLVKLDSSAGKLQRYITTDLIRAVESVFEALNVTYMKCSDLLQDTVAKTFSIFCDQVQHLQKFCSEYKQDFMKKLADLLPEIRGGKTDIKHLTELLEAHEKSPFHACGLQQWIEVKEKKSNQLKTLLKQLCDLGAEVTDDIDRYLLDLNVENLVAYAFTCLQHQDPFLTKQKIYLNPSTKKYSSENTHDLDYQEKSWTFEEKMSMKKELKMFSDLIALNKSQTTKFIVQSIPQASPSSASCILLYENGYSKAVCFVPPSKPTSPTIESVTENSITVQLSTSCSATLQRKLLYKMKQDNDWKSQPVHQDIITLTDLQENNDYEIKCAAEGKLDYIVESDVMTVSTKESEQTPMERHKSETTQNMTDNNQSKVSNNMQSRIQNNNNYTKLSTGNPSVYLLNLKDPGRGNLCIKDFGCPNFTKPNKTIMLLGATGSGKTTLINGMINYILGVEWSDTCRLKLIDEQTNKTQAESQTSDVTAYQLHYQNDFQVPYSVTIIDTPGFGDTRGIAQDKEITEKIRNFFSLKDGILELDAVCFVVQSALARLTPTPIQNIFEAILSIFGKDIANNITIMITFADGQKPPVLEAIKAADIPCVKKEDGTFLHFKFNNSALFAQTEKVGDDDENFDKMFWKMGKVNMKRFFTHLAEMETKSLQLTKEVLSERKQLEAVVAGVQPLIQTGLKKLDEIKMIKAALEQNQNVIKENENFEYEVEEPKTRKIDLERGTFVTNCLGCNLTCHYPCGIPEDKDKRGCAAIKNGNCTVCPGRCVWNVHHNVPYRFETYTVKEKRTYTNLKKQYEEALGKKMTKEKIIKHLEEEYYDVQVKVLQLNDELARSLTRLKKIALRPDPLSTPDYIEILIESEKQTAKEGYLKRIAELEKLKIRASILQKVERGEQLAPHEEVLRARQTIGQNFKGITM